MPLRSRGIALAVLGALLALPGAASADSGSITNVQTLSTGEVIATYTTNGTCAGETNPNFCGWWPHAVQGPVNLPCYEYVSGDGRLTYVGGPSGDIYTGPASETATETFYPDWNPVRICLYINYGSDNRVLVADYVHPGGGAPPPPPPPPAAVPRPTSPTTVPPMSTSEARGLIARVLKDEFGKRFNRFTLRRSCARRSVQKVKCRVSWRKGRFAYKGSVTLWNDPADPARSYLTDTSIRRKRIKGRASMASMEARASAARR